MGSRILTLFFNKSISRKRSHMCLISNSLCEQPLTTARDCHLWDHSKVELKNDSCLIHSRLSYYYMLKIIMVNILYCIVVICNVTGDYQNSHFTSFAIETIKKRDFIFKLKKYYNGLFCIWINCFCVYIYLRYIYVNLTLNIKS